MTVDDIGGEVMARHWIEEISKPISITQFEINHTFWDENEKRAKNGRPLLVELSKEKLKELGIGMVQ